MQRLYFCDKNFRMVSSVEEQFPYTEYVGGSNPSPSTISVGPRCYGSIRALGACGQSSILCGPTKI